MLFLSQLLVPVLAAARVILSPLERIGHKTMAMKKVLLTIIGLASETYPMTFLLLSFSSLLLAAWQDFGFGANIFAAVAIAEYAIGWLAHKRRGTWSRKKAGEGVITIVVQVLLLALVHFCRRQAGIAIHIGAYIAFFWAANGMKTALRNAAYLGVPAIPGILETLDWLMARLSRLLIPIERLNEDEQRRATMAARSDTGTVSLLIGSEPVKSTSTGAS